jgi:hypothetical protein
MALSVDPSYEHPLDQAADRRDRGLRPSAIRHPEPTPHSSVFLHGQDLEQTSPEGEFIFAAHRHCEGRFGDGTDYKDELVFGPTARTFTQRHS